MSEGHGRALHTPPFAHGQPPRRSVLAPPQPFSAPLARSLPFLVHSSFSLCRSSVHINPMHCTS